MSDNQSQQPPEFEYSDTDLHEWLEKFAEELDKAWQEVDKNDNEE